MSTSEQSSVMNNLKLSEFYKSHVIAGFGNPLLDISAIIRGEKVLDKYNLKPDGQKEVNNDEFSDILLTLKSENYEVTYSPGGCTQNTLRVVQALVKYPSVCVFFGGIGDDKEGEFLESELMKCGVDTRYKKHPTYPTGRATALINGENRSLVAHLGAAEIYSVEDFSTPDNLEIIAEVSIVYIEGFFITHSFDVALEVINLCKTQGIVVAFNISGAYVADAHPRELRAMSTAADIIIGNAGEVRALGNVLDLGGSSVEDVALKVHISLWEMNTSVKFKLNQINSFGKTLIVTQGKDPIFFVRGDKSLIKFEVPYLDRNLIKDPTGAGDAFAAGFLVAFLQHKSATECLAYGCEIAQQVIQHIGVNLPN